MYFLTFFLLNIVFYVYPKIHGVYVFSGFILCLENSMIKMY